jgi:hypothetical protein
MRYPFSKSSVSVRACAAVDFVDSVLEDLKMLAARSAILLVALNLVVSPAALCGSSGESPRKDCLITSSHFDPSVARLIVARLPHSSGIACFTPWKARPKIVMGETHSPLAEEDDLGPMPLPHGPISPWSIDSTASHLAVLPPMRC